MEPDRRLPVLVADDDESLRRLYVRALERDGFATREAVDGLETLRVVGSEPLCLVLLDIHMPSMEGVEIVQRMRANEATRTLPVILITGTAELAEMVRGLDAGADDYVLKTADLKELVARVRTHVRSRAAWAAALGRELANRARIVASLSSVGSGATPEETAAQFVERLSATPGLAFVSLLVAEGEGELAPLAGWSASFGVWTGGPALAPASSRHLLERAAGGPWAETELAPTAEHRGRFSPSEIGTACFTPLKQDDELLGLLVIAAPPAHPALGPSGDLLAATIDFGAVATAVLAPQLVARRHRARSRRDIEQLIDDRAFTPHYQPLVRLADRHVVGYEGLTRFDDGERPDLRFREAVRIGLGRRLEREVIAEILRQGAVLPHDAILAVNVTPSLILDPGWLLDLAGETVQPLVVELTEHAEVADYEELRRALAALRPRFDVAVDDAGAGFASLRHILELRPRFVKLDMALVRGIERDEGRQSLIAGLDQSVRAMGGTTIAEGVETEAEAEALARLGLTVGQGYLFGRPAPAGEWESSRPR